ncbi:hypothetical protein GCM10009789_64760 [Kribbella sancticallisti]|uniref:Lipoprotein n=1 Tax=Kribbella sancticallisti TaxID=460087 RepID=A0ABP4Q778_9ACTN
MSTALLFGTTACSNSDEQSTDKPADSATPASSTPSDKPSDTPLADLPAAQVVSGLSGAGYKCSNDGTYAICTTGPVAVWVLTGDHNRPPQVSLHSSGPAETATDAVAKILPQALEIAHINPRTQIVDWFGQQAGQPTAQLSAGDWQVSWTVESADSEEPGVHLTLSDKLCKANCQAE